MTTDFKATQVQTNKIIVTGSFAGDGSNQLLIYNYTADDSGTPNQGVIDPTKFDTTSGIGSDVFLFVSGGVATRGTGGSYGVTVMGGDLHVSGNLTVDGTYPSGGGGGGNDYWQSTESDVIFNTGSIRQGTDVIIDPPVSNSIIFSSDNNARLYGGYSNSIISSYEAEIRNTSLDPGDVTYNTIISDQSSVIDGDSVAFITALNLIGAGTNHVIQSGSISNAILASAFVHVTESLLNSVIAASNFPLPTATTIYKAVNSAIIAGGPNVISSSDGLPIRSSAIIGSNWTINSSFTYAIGDTVNAAQVLMSASNGVEITAPVRIFGSLAQGDGSNTVGSSDSHAEGVFTNAQAAGSHAEGSSTLSSGDYSHAEGYFTVASVDYAHAEGVRTLSEGIGSHSEGYLTTGSGDYSHAEGWRTIARGEGSHAEGQGTIASGTYQHVQGRFNKRGNNFSLFVIGDGTGDADANRSDIIRVNLGSSEGIGTVEITGSLSVSGSSSTFSAFTGVRYFPDIVTSLPFTASLTDYIIAVSSSNPTAATNYGIELPGAEFGRTFVVKDISGSAASSNITVTAAGSNDIQRSIDGASNYVLSINRGSATFVYFGDTRGWGVI